MFKYLTNRKYRLFAKKIKAVQDSIWEMDFKISKSRQIREGVRQDRDREIESIHKIKFAIENTKEGEDTSKLTEQLTAAEDNVKRYEAQMRMVDAQINGAAGTETSEAIVGQTELLASYAELREMYKSYLKTI